MGERKVLNRYFPPDFDPLLVPKRKYDPYKQVEVRMMIPFSLQCIKCGEYMYRGKKFNSRKEDVIGDDYLGIKKYRFYIKCCVCNNEIAFKTDPKNQDYVCESGVLSASFVFFVFATCAAMACPCGVRRARPRPASARPRGVAARRWRAGGVQTRRRRPRERVRDRQHAIDAYQTQAPRATSSPGASRTRPRRSSRASARRRPRRTR